MFNKLNKDFLRHYNQSVRYKDWGMLQSALDERLRATKFVLGNPGQYALSKTTEAVLLMHHIGDGVGAYAALKEALKDIDALAMADKKWKFKKRYSLLKDSLCFVVYLAESYGEAIDYCKKTIQYVPRVQYEKVLSQLQESRQNGMPWWKMQFYMSQAFCTRTSAAQDNGKYAAGTSILLCILQRASDGKPGYDIDEENIFNMLDDCLSYSVQTYNIIFPKFSKGLKKRKKIVLNADGPKEQFIVFRETLRLWLKLMPYCPEKWKRTFQAHYELFMKSPNRILIEQMDKISNFFPYQ